jgi:hypothetical protein
MHYERAPDRATPVNARGDLGSPVLIVVDGC